MAPATHTFNPILAYTNMSAATTTFTTLTLGRTAHAIELLVPTAPPVHASSDLKARCFDYLADLLLEHSSLYSSAELIAAFGHIPGSTYNATLESSTICSSIRSAFYQLPNLVGLGFRDHLGSPVTTSITANPTTRPAGISYFAFRSTVTPATIDSRILLPSFTIEFWLALPQTLLVAAQPTPATNLLDQFTTPAKTPPPPRPPKTTAVDLQLLEATALAALGTATSLDTLSDYSPDCYPLFTPIQLQQLLLRIPATPAALPPPALALVSPRMTAVLASTVASGSSYYGSLDFLDSQSVFDLTFPNPLPLRVIPSSTTSLSVDSLSLQQSLTAFIDQCKFQVFLPIFRSDYVGTADRNDAASLHATVQALKKLSMSYRNPANGHWLNLTPDELYAEYSALTPLLPARVSLWGMNLVSQFHDALSPDLQDLLLADSTYLTPDLSSLTCRSTQLAALRSLRFFAVRHHTLMRAQEKLVARTIARKLKHAPAALTVPFSAAVSPPSSVPGSEAGASDDVSAITKVFLSPAEQTMQRYQPPPVDGPPSFPVDPTTNFQSPYPVGFRGCMFCGSNDHVFRACPQNATAGASNIFYKNLFAHKPHLRKRPPLPSAILPLPPSLPLPGTQSFPSPTLSAPPLPSLQIPPPDSPALPPPAPSSILKRARFMVQIVKTFSTRTPSPRPVLPPMPISIDNGLPHITFNLGAHPTRDPSLCGLMDTCGALNTGYLTFHLWLMSERPDIVAEFHTFDDSNPFKPVKLGGAIRDPSDFDAADHGNLTAVIRYFTPYTDTTGAPITLSFALGPDVTVNTIFGLPMLCDLDSVISLTANSLQSRALNVDFPITRAAATFGLPPDCTFDPTSASRVHASTSGLHANSADCPAAPPLALACDDTSTGYLRRTVHPTT